MWLICTRCGSVIKAKKMQPLGVMKDGEFIPMHRYMVCKDMTECGQRVRERGETRMKPSTRVK